MIGSLFGIGVNSERLQGFCLFYIHLKKKTEKKERKEKKENLFSFFIVICCQSIMATLAILLVAESDWAPKRV